MSNFAQAKQRFDETYSNYNTLPVSLVPVRGKTIRDIQIRGADGRPLEEYYRWQFIYALINSRLYAKDYIGAEVHFPKGSSSSAALKMDGAIFDSPDWLQHYNDYWKHRRSADLQWLNRSHLINPGEAG